MLQYLKPDGWVSMVKYPCESCGSCCRQIGSVVEGAVKLCQENPDAPDLVKLVAMFPYAYDISGCCTALDQNTNKCVIYENRPIVCNMAELYKEFYSAAMTEEEYYEQSKESCKMLRSKLL
jgi:hypothetical protein